MTSYNYDPRNSTFIFFNEVRKYSDECIKAMVLDCDGDWHEWDLTPDDARAIALHLIQAADLADSHKTPRAPEL